MNHKTGEFRLIDPGLIKQSAVNLRKKIAGPKFDELVSSVKEKGVLEPVIVRKIKAKIPFEIVAGTRRLWAAKKAGLAEIPAIVRELTDDEAFDLMLIENLQREDLTELEEAESFKGWVEKSGEMGVQILAEKLSISPRYVRRRIAVLELPKKTLEAWSSGKLKYGHLEQLLRVAHSPALLREKTRLALEEDRWDGRTSVEKLKRSIDKEAPPLKKALFPVSEECAACPKSSIAQKSLFGIGEAEAEHCLDEKCFKKKQNDWLQTHWKETELHKKYKTNGFRFEDSVNWADHETVYHPDEKCLACPNFLTIIDELGEVRFGHNRECFNKKCLRSRAAASKAKISRADAGGKPGEPRVSWHGIYFRDVFFSRRIPEAISALGPEDEKVKTLLLVAALHGNGAARDAVWRAFGVKPAQRWSEAELYRRILGLPYAKVRRFFAEAARSIIMEGAPETHGIFGEKNRRRIAEFLGVNLSKEWAATDDYLQKKTKAEIVEFGKKQKIFSDKKAKDYLQVKLRGRDPAKLKKGELVDLVLKSGVDLVGKVPGEILPPKEKAGK